MLEIHSMNNKLNIFQALQQVKDNRRKEGTRHNIAVVLLINIMAIMSGYTGIRSKQDFVNRNSKELAQIFDSALVKHGLPSKNTIDRTMQVIDCDDLNQVLSKVFELPEGSVIHLDGKAIRSTITLGQSSKQTFTSIVTAYANGKGVMAKSFVNGSKNNEISRVQELIKIRH
jgi:hypothetical protein